MNKKGFIKILMVLSMSICFLAGCNKKNADKQNESIQPTVQETTPEKDKETDKEDEKETSQVDENKEQDVVDEEMSDTPSVDERLASAEYSEQEQNELLENPNITQYEMNQVAAEIYRIWDDELNWIWDELESGSDTDKMESLRKEQLEWITKKEEAMKKAGAEFEGGTMQPLMEWTEGADMTKKRVYELAKLLH